MRKVVFCIVVAAMLVACKDSTPVLECSMPYQIVDGTIVLDEPQRPAGQESMFGVACEPLETIRVGFVGLGRRGTSNFKRFSKLEGVKVVAICDKYAEKLEGVKAFMEQEGMDGAAEYVGPEAYKELCERDDIDAVYICTDWLMHTPVAVYAMDHGKHAILEVPSATSVKECWDLVDASERNRRHCIMLENCCYSQFEMTCLNMAQKGMFGEIVHGEGAYLHYRGGKTGSWKGDTDSWRLAFNQGHSGDNYPTHGLGPVCQAMNINRGDRMTRLVAMGTKAANSAGLGKEFLEDGPFKEGDHVCTLISTEKGHEILLEHDVYNPRQYSRMYQLVGTEGMAAMYPYNTFAFRETAPAYEEFGERAVDKFVLVDEVRQYADVFPRLMEEYKHPVYAEYEEKALLDGGHGGMDYVLNARVVYCLRNGLPMDISVYDLATWCCPIELGAISIDSGNMPVAVPDFTRGDWDKYSTWTFAKQ